MKPQHPDWRAAVAADFAGAPFVAALGITPVRIEPGIVEAELEIRPEHLQQAGTVHAGVQATLADHCAGGAAGTLLAAGEGVVSVEFKVHLLRPARGERLRCRAQVVKPGRRFHVVEARVYVDDPDKPTALLLGTMAAVPRER
ncbi:MAG: PaaI family thioesterase [Myxococcales bacterium]|nr:PaaI family thioesterase [Myxococcales bacterium]MCB9543978.1 PaaI family thioesterase [Myxococcales bacterium]MCB9550307.1 PaaI family thioesterase [Myxococcales bacterium]